MLDILAANCSSDIEARSATDVHRFEEAQARFLQLRETAAKSKVEGVPLIVSGATDWTDIDAFYTEWLGLEIPERAA